MDKVLLRYVRNRQKEPVGCVAAVLNSDGVVKIGHCLVHDQDRKSINSKPQIRALAISRALTGYTGVLPHSVKSDLDEIVKRAKSYFKDADFMDFNFEIADEDVPEVMEHI